MAKRPRAPQLVNPPFGRAAVRDSTTNALTYYPSPSLAAAAAPDGGTIELFGDYGTFTIDKNLTVLAWFSRCIDVDQAGGVAIGFSSGAPITVNWYGGQIDGRLALCRGKARHTGYFFGLDMRRPTSFVQFLALGSVGAGLDLWTLDNCRLNRIVLVQRNDFIHSQGIYFAGKTRIGTPQTTESLVTGLANPATIMTNDDTVFLVPAGKQAFDVLRASDSTAGPLLLQGSAHSNSDLPSYQASGTVDGWRVASSVNPRVYLGGDYWYPASGVTPTAPAQVGTVTPTAGDAQVSLAFAGVAGATTYKAFSRPAGSGSYVLGISGSTSPLTITGLTNGAARDFQVVASNAGGDAPPSATVTATPMASVVSHAIVPADLHMNSDNFTRSDGKKIYSSLAMVKFTVTGGTFSATIENTLASLSLPFGSEASVAVWENGMPYSYLGASGSVTLSATTSKEVWLVFSFSSKTGHPTDLAQTIATAVSVPSGGTLTMIAPSPQPWRILVTGDSTTVGVGNTIEGFYAQVMGLRTGHPTADVICVYAWGGQTIQYVAANNTAYQAAVTAAWTGATKKGLLGQLMYNDRAASRSTSQVANDWATVIDPMYTNHPTVVQVLGDGYYTTNDDAALRLYGNAVAALTTGREARLSIMPAHTVPSAGNLSPDGVHNNDAGEAEKLTVTNATALFEQLLARYEPSSMVFNGSNILTRWNDTFGNADIVVSNTTVSPVRVSGKLTFDGTKSLDGVAIPGLAAAGNGTGVTVIMRVLVTPSTSGFKFVCAFGTNDSNVYCAIGYFVNYWGFTTYTDTVSGISDAPTKLGVSEVVVRMNIRPQDPDNCQMWVNGVLQTEASTPTHFSGGNHMPRILSGTMFISLGGSQYNGTLQKIEVAPLLSDSAGAIAEAGF